MKDNGEFFEPFPVTNGVKQSCVLALTLFSMLFSAMLTDAFRNENVGIAFRSRTDGGFYKPQRLRTQSKVMLDVRLTNGIVAKTPTKLLLYAIRAFCGSKTPFKFEKHMLT